MIATLFFGCAPPHLLLPLLLPVLSPSPSPQGWTSSADPLSQLSVRFPSREAAEAYATRNGYDYVTMAAPEAAENVRSFSAYGKSMVHQWRHDAVPVYAADAEEEPKGR